MIISIPTTDYKSIEQISKYKFAVRYDVTEDTEQGITTAEEQTITLSKVDYSNMVSGVISIKYSKDAELATINNYIADGEGYATEYQAYQDWRNYAKKVSKEYFGITDD